MEKNEIRKIYLWMLARAGDEDPQPVSLLRDCRECRSLSASAACRSHNWTIHKELRNCMYVTVADHRVWWCCQCLIYGYFVDPLREKGLLSKLFKVDQMEMILGVIWFWTTCILADDSAWGKASDELPCCLGHLPGVNGEVAKENKLL